MACLTNYTIQCTDVTTGDVGCFLFDTEHWARTGEFKALCPVFESVGALYLWDRANGNRCAGCYTERQT